MDKENVLEDNKQKDVLNCMSEEELQDETGGLKLQQNKNCSPMVAYGFIDPTKKLKERLLYTKPVLEDDKPFSPDN